MDPKQDLMMGAEAPAEPPMPEAAPAGEIHVPLAALAMPDEQEQMTPPEVGDKGQANMEYTVSRVEGDQAFITLDALNGQKLAGDKAPTDDQEMANLQEMAKGQPDSY